MNNPVKLKDIFLGLPDGATEAQNKNFQELFFDPNNKYDELMNNSEKFMIIGSKGTGKTYLANYVLSKSPKTQIAELVDASDFSIYKLSNIYDMDLNADLMKALSKWFLLDKTAHFLIDKHPCKSRIPLFNIYKLKKLVAQYDNYDFFKTVKKIDTGRKEGQLFREKSESALKSKKTGANYNLSKTLEIESERKKFFELINSYEKLLFQSFSRKDDILIIIDDLDEIEKDRNKIGDIIISLINEAKDYNLKTKKHGLKAKVILVLRSDILDELQIHNANLSKIKTSCSVELYWLFDSLSEQYKHPLMSMVLHKIKASCPKYKEIDNKKLFSDLFPEQIDGKRPLDFLLDYSFGRPRDIITYLNHTKREYPEDTCFSAVALKETRKFYSSDFYNEMLNQASFHQKPEYVKQCLNLLSSVKKQSFWYSEIKNIYETNKDKYTEISNLDEALSFLYKIGAIGNVWKLNKKIHTCWAYKKEAMDDIDLSKKFTIHYGLRKKFSL